MTKNCKLVLLIQRVSSPVWVQLWVPYILEWKSVPRTTQINSATIQDHRTAHRDSFSTHHEDHGESEKHQHQKAKLYRTYCSITTWAHCIEKTSIFSIPDRLYHNIIIVSCFDDNQDSSILLVRYKCGESQASASRSDSLNDGIQIHMHMQIQSSSILRGCIFPHCAAHTIRMFIRRGPHDGRLFRRIILSAVVVLSGCFRLVPGVPPNQNDRSKRWRALLS